MYTLKTINSENPVFCAVAPQTEEEKVALYNAVQNPTGGVEDILGEVKSLINARGEYKRYIDDDGEVQEYVQLLLIFDDGTCYKTGSRGILYALNDMFNIFGTPDCWSEPKKMKIKKVGKMYTIVLVQEV